MIEIITLGNFEVRIDGKNMADFFKKTNKLLTFLNLLIINRNKPLSVEYICEAVWNEDDVNAQKALHNLVYRLRRFFASNGIDDCIVHNNRTYMLNGAIYWKVDIYQMEDNIRKSASPALSMDEKVACLEEALKLYGGEYILNQICEDMHSYYVPNHYKRLFSNAVCTLSDVYLGSEKYDDVVSICERAILLEPLEEPIVLRFTQALRGMNKDIQAIALLESYFKRLYYETGMQASETLNKLYETLKGRDGNAKPGVSVIADSLKEVSSLGKPFFCYFDVFKEIYRYEVRQNERNESSILLILADIYGHKDQRLSEWLLEKSLKSLHESCMNGLRKGDMFSYYSKQQVIMMLVVTKGANISNILDRISKKFYNNVKGDKVYVKMETMLDIVK